MLQKIKTELSLAGGGVFKTFLFKAGQIRTIEYKNK
jgi:hypothetical protein